MTTHIGKYRKYTRKLSPRLKDFDYKGYYVYFITCNTYKDRKYFKDEETIKEIVDILKDVIEQYGFKLICYCFMPNHLHLLVGGISEMSSLKKFIQVFKQKTAYHFKESKNEILWHRNYFDHTVRKEENISNICDYILNNPVRRGLVQDYRNYPYSYVNVGN